HLFVLQPGATALGAEDNVNQDTCQGLRHALQVSPAPSELGGRLYHHPGLRPGLCSRAPSELTTFAS
ncbi:MAG TPA: hypothetical protein PLX97_02275, partial [Gemmatales bacterium]|nr:hypothetical protein [Gemmatales bacterium]